MTGEAPKRTLFQPLLIGWAWAHGTLGWLVLYLLMLPSMAAEEFPAANPPPPGGGSLIRPFVYLTEFEFILSLLVIFFGLVTLGIEYALLRKTSFDSADKVTILILTLVVVSTVFVITAGFNDRQIAPAMGLFGTIAGYLLGHNKGKKDE